MTNATVTIVINAAKEVTEAVRDEIDAQPASQSYITERRNLDGDTAMWLLIANLAVQALPPILTFLKDYLPGKRVTKIKIGDLEIENPTPADLEKFRTMINSHSKLEKADD
jgi:hypothetical protein